MSHSRRKLIAIGAAVLVVAAVALLTSGFGLLGHHQENRLVLNGNVDIRQVDLGFRVMGRIAAIPFEEGEHAPAGAILARGLAALAKVVSVTLATRLS